MYGVGTDWDEGLGGRAVRRFLLLWWTMAVRPRSQLFPVREDRPQEHRRPAFRRALQGTADDDDFEGVCLHVAVGEPVILLPPPPPPVGVSMWMERGVSAK